MIISVVVQKMRVTAAAGSSVAASRTSFVSSSTLFIINRRADRVCDIITIYEAAVRLRSVGQVPVLEDS